MADVTSADVTLNAVWTQGGPAGKDLSCRQVTIVASNTWGLNAGAKVPVATLGLSKVIDASLFISSATATCLQVVPSFDGTLLVIPDAANATPGFHTTIQAAGLPAGNGTFRGVVTGYL